jgi:hypothetical protein
MQLSEVASERQEYAFAGATGRKRQTSWKKQPFFPQPKDVRKGAANAPKSQLTTSQNRKVKHIRKNALARACSTICWASASAFNNFAKPA